MKYAITENLDSAMKEAQLAAKRYANPGIGTEPILYGLIKVADSTASKILRGVGVDLAFARIAFEGGEHVSVIGEIDFTPRVRALFATALNLARSLGKRAIGIGFLIFIVTILF